MYICKRKWLSFFRSGNTIVKEAGSGSKFRNLWRLEELEAEKVQLPFAT